MTATHRPLSAWIAYATPVGLGPTNAGDDHADARFLPKFAGGWRRTPMSEAADETALALVREADGLIAVELDDYGRPIMISAGALRAVDAAERQWPLVDRPLLGQLSGLRVEPLALRFWLLERLDAEGEPPDELFAILPWELLEQAAANVARALPSAADLGDVVEIRHWLTPAIRGVAGPVEQIDQGLRTDDPDIVEAGITALLANLSRLSLSRIPARTRDRLADLVDRIGQVYAFHHERATTAARRLRLRPSEDGPPRPRLYHAELVEIGHLGPEDDPQRTTATLQFSAEAAELLGSAVRGTVAWTPQGLEVMLSRFAEATPPLTVEVEGAAMASRMTSRGRALHAIVTWSEPGLPQRLVFRVASADSSPAEDGDE